MLRQKDQESKATPLARPPGKFEASRGYTILSQKARNQTKTPLKCRCADLTRTVFLKNLTAQQARMRETMRLIPEGAVIGGSHVTLGPAEVGTTAGEPLSTC